MLWLFYLHKINYNINSRKDIFYLYIKRKNNNTLLRSLKPQYIQNCNYFLKGFLYTE